MTIDALINAIPPPVEPLEPFAGSWEPVEAYLGTALPQDYKDLARLYGRGRFMAFLYVNLPGSSVRRGSLESELGLAGEMVNYGMPVPYPVWPEPGGLLNVGLTEFNDRLFWLTRGDPADWPIVVWDRALQRLETFDCSLTDFLARLAAGEVAPEGFVGRSAPSDPLFEPLQCALGPAGTDRPDGVQSSRTTGRGIEALTRLVTPPLEPFRAFSGPWGPVEAYLGTTLPQDYKDFVRLYGSGLLVGLVSIHTPGTKNPYLSLAVQVREASGDSMPDQQAPYRLWPRIDGLIKFGGTDNGDQLYWLPHGPPEDWKVVFWDCDLSDDKAFEAFDCSVAEFLAGLVDGTIVPGGYEPEDLQPVGPVFQPYTDRPEDA